MMVSRVASLGGLALWVLIVVPGFFATDVGAAPPPSSNRDWSNQGGNPGSGQDAAQPRSPAGPNSGWNDDSDSFDSIQGEFERIITPEYRRSGMSVEKMPGGRLRLRLPSEVLFAYDSADISRAFAPTLREVARILSRRPRLRANIIGHTDDVGSDSYNLDLSLRRARSVAMVLSDYGVDSFRLRTEGRGKREPVASNATPQGRQLNRRVEIILSRSRGDRAPPRNRP